MPRDLLAPTAPEPRDLLAPQPRDLLASEKKLFPGEVVDPQGRPGQMIPTTILRDPQTGATTEVTGDMNNIDALGEASFAGLEVAGPGAGEFRPRFLHRDKAGNVDYAESMLDLVRGAARGTASLFQAVLIDLPEFAARLPFEGTQAVEAFDPDQGTISGPVRRAVAEPTRGVGVFSENVTPWVVPGSALMAPVKAAGRTVQAGGRTVSRVTGRTARKAEASLQRWETSFARARAEGVPFTEAKVIASAEARIAPGELIPTVRNAGRNPRIPMTQPEAIIAVRASSLGGNRQLSAVREFVQPIYDRIRDVSPRLWERLMRFEHEERQLLRESLERAGPLFKAYDALNRGDRLIVKKALLNGDFDAAAPFLGNEAIAGWKSLANDLYFAQVANGMKLDKVDNWFPRVIPDAEKLLNALRPTERARIKQAIRDVEDAAGHTLSDIQRANLITATISGRGTRKSLPPSSVYARRLNKIPDNVLKYYSDPIQAAHIALRSETRNLSKRRFLGQYLKHTDDPNVIDMDRSIGEFLAKRSELDALGVRDEVQGLLRARMLEGEESPGWIVQGLRNLTYTGTIGNPLGALTQAKDIGIAMARFGFRDTIAGVLGKKHAKAADLGLTQLYAELEQSTRRSAQIMEWSLRRGGFNMMDRFGKEVQMASAMRKLWRGSKTEAGQQEIIRKWGRVYGLPETRRLIDDLQARTVNDRVKAHLFNELSEVQPITLGQVPLKYLQVPNGRLFYTLTTFTLRQMSMLIRAAKARGSKAGAAKELGRYAYYMGIAGLGVDGIKDMLKGRELSAEEVPVGFGAQLTSAFFASKYVLEQAAKGKIGAASIGQVTNIPAVKVLDNIGTGFIELMAEGDPSKLVQHAGPFAPLYYWFGDGLEKIERENREKGEGGLGVDLDLGLGL